MPGSCHIWRVELSLFSFKFSAEQKSELKEYKSLRTFSLNLSKNRIRNAPTPTY